MKEMIFRKMYGLIFSDIDKPVSKPILVTVINFAETLLQDVAFSLAAPLHANLDHSVFDCHLLNWRWPSRPSIPYLNLMHKRTMKGRLLTQTST